MHPEGTSKLKFGEAVAGLESRGVGEPRECGSSGGLDDASKNAQSILQANGDMGCGEAISAGDWCCNVSML